MLSFKEYIKLIEYSCAYTSEILMEAGDVNATLILRGLLHSFNLELYILKANACLNISRIITLGLGIMYIVFISPTVSEVSLEDDVTNIAFILWFSLSLAMYFGTAIDVVIRYQVGSKKFLKYPPAIHMLIYCIVTTSALTSSSALILILRNIYPRISELLAGSLLIVWLTYICFIVFESIYWRTKRRLDSVSIF